MYDYFKGKKKKECERNIHEALPVDTSSQLCEFHSPYRVTLAQSDYFRLVFEAPRVISAVAEKRKVLIISILIQK